MSSLEACYAGGHSSVSPKTSCHINRKLMIVARVVGVGLFIISALAVISLFGRPLLGTTNFCILAPVSFSSAIIGLVVSFAAGCAPKIDQSARNKPTVPETKAQQKKCERGDSLSLLLEKFSKSSVLDLESERFCQHLQGKEYILATHMETRAQAFIVKLDNVFKWYGTSTHAEVNEIRETLRNAGWKVRGFSSERFDKKNAVR